MTTDTLKNRSIIEVKGELAAGFLHRLLTNDVEHLAVGEARYAALLIPQGKIVADMLVVRVSKGVYWLDLPQQRAQAAMQKLLMYRLRDPIIVAPLEKSVVAIWGEEVNVAVEDDFITRDPRHPDLGARRYTDKPPAASGLYDAHRIALGVPEGGRDFLYDDNYPHDANMDWLHGIDFKKGCYVGQEIVSRMEHRGTARKRIVRLRFEGNAPQEGAEILAGDTPIGRVGSSAGNTALGLLRIDKAEGQSLIAEGIALDRKKFL